MNPFGIATPTPDPDLWAEFNEGTARAVAENRRRPQVERFRDAIHRRDMEAAL